MVIEAYSSAALATAHARCVTGAGVVSLLVRDRLPEEIRDDLLTEFEDDEVTPQAVEVSLTARPRGEPGDEDPEGGGP